MRTLKYSYIILLGLLFHSCNGKTQVKVENMTLTHIKNDTFKAPPIPQLPSGLKISAYLIFDDKSLSTFDILNDKTIALWNTIIGGGDALKPSHKTKIVFTGKLDSLRVTIFNGVKKVENQLLPNFSGDFEFTINETGCEEVKIVVDRLGKIVYGNKIKFKCGE
jgi:hypothetical protein